MVNAPYRLAIFKLASEPARTAVNSLQASRQRSKAAEHERYGIFGHAEFEGHYRPLQAHIDILPVGDYRSHHDVTVTANIWWSREPAPGL